MPNCFIVRAAHGQQLASPYSASEPGRPAPVGDTGGGWIEPYARATLAQTSKGEARVTKDGILELEQRRFKAMCDGDADALGALLHDGLTYTHSSGTVDSKESYTRGVREKLWHYQSIKASDATVSIAG